MVFDAHRPIWRAADQANFPAQPQVIQLPTPHAPAGQRSWVGRRLVRLGDELVMYRKTANNSLVPLGEAQLRTLGNSEDVPLTRPGQVVALSVDMRAPPGSCTVACHWQMVDADNQPCFGPDCYLSAVVTVVGV
ncbi:hypothetical protein ACHEXK_05400 [Limnohabitans sp. DCL3]|uniref:hypothetical protein n=1 Tax=Limnohabitans sp. DCL3 TaxID=3374103 RepID=UPI003A845168